VSAVEWVPLEYSKGLDKSMLKDCKPVILLPTLDREKATTFFRDVLGLTFKGDDGFALVFVSAGIMLRVTPVKEFTPHQFSVLSWEVDDISTAVNGLSERGVSFERYEFPWMKQDELGIWTAPDGTKVAWFKDPDGNLLSVSQHSS
jgi:catechol 2,3-dioxygenase-like lactoylglutathione lyase family enzyme